MSAEAPRKRRRAVSHSTPLVPREELQAFWQNVTADDTREVDLFLSTHPDVLATWKGHDSLLQSGPFVTYARCETDTPCVGALLLFYAHGFAIAPGCFPALLSAFFGESLKGDAVIQTYTDSINKRLEAFVKLNSANATVLLAAAAAAQNLSAFQFFYGKLKKHGLAFDVNTAVKGPNILRSVVAWCDPSVRRELVPDIMTKCTLGYVLECSDSGAGGMMPSNVLEDIVCVRDVELLAVVLRKLKNQAPQNVLTAAAQFAIKLHAAGTAPAFEELESMIVQLTATLDGVHIGALHAHVRTLKECAIATKRVLDNDLSNPLYKQACNVLGALPKVLAACAAAEKECRASAFKDMGTTETAFIEDDTHFQEQYQRHYKVIEVHADTVKQVHALTSKCRALEDALAAHSSNLRVIQTQTATIAKLRAEMVSADPSPMQQAEQELQKSVDDIIQDLETRLLSLQLPVAPTSGHAAAAARRALSPIPVAIRK
jgi:hypothetical protein